jgi:hypothetical protein
MVDMLEEVEGALLEGSSLSVQADELQGDGDATWADGLPNFTEAAPAEASH